MADTALLDADVSASPKQYSIPGAQEIIVKSASASFDGSAASGQWVPALQVVAPNGTVLSTFPLGSALAAGASADVSWFPRGGVNTQAAGGDGIKFDTWPQTGDWLAWLTTDATGSPDGYGTDIESTAGILIQDDSGTGLALNENGAGGIDITDGGGGSIQIEEDGTGGIVVQTQSSTLGGLLLRDFGAGGLTLQTSTVFSGGTGGILLQDNGAAGTSGITLEQKGGQQVAMFADYHSGIPAGQVSINANGTFVLANVGNSAGTLAIDIAAGTIEPGGNNPGQWVRVSPNVLLDAYITEPDPPGQGAFLYLYTDGTPQTHLRVVFANGTRVNLADD